MTEIVAYMLSCAERVGVRGQTLVRLARTDWDADPVVVVDDASLAGPDDRQCQTARRLLDVAACAGAAHVLFLEDDLDFNRHLRHNLSVWQPLARTGRDDHFMGSLYDPGVASNERDHVRAYSIARPDCVYGSQAMVLSRATILHILDRWDRVVGGQDIRFSRLAGEVTPIYYHRPSLVQHVAVPSTWGGCTHRARDYSASWRALGLTPA